MAIPASVPASPNQLAARLTAPGRLSLAHWRVAFRLGWFAVIVGTFGLVALAIPVRYAQLLRTAQNVTPAQSLVVNDVLAVFGQSLEAHIRTVLVIESNWCALSVPVTSSLPASSGASCSSPSSVESAT